MDKGSDGQETAMAAERLEQMAAAVAAAATTFFP